MRLITITCLAVVASISGYGQRSDTIFQQIGKNVNTAPFHTVNVQSIGQSQHLVYILVVNAPAHTCINPSVRSFFQGSFDNTNFFPLSTASTLGAFSTNPNLTLFTTGLAPYVRLMVESFDFTNCNLNIFYSGSLYPVYVSKMESTLLEGGYNFVPTGIIISATTVVPIAAKVGYSVAIMGLTCSNGGTAQQVNMGNMTVYFGANDTKVWPTTGLPYDYTGIGVGYAVNTTDVGPFYCLINFRYEH